MTVFWDVAPCILLETDQRFRGAYYLHHQGALMSKHLWNFGQILAECTAQHPRRKEWNRIALLQQ
jgi:hypothetical protein